MARLYLLDKEYASCSLEDLQCRLRPATLWNPGLQLQLTAAQLGSGELNRGSHLFMLLAPRQEESLFQSVAPASLAQHTLPSTLASPVSSRHRLSTQGSFTLSRKAGSDRCSALSSVNPLGPPPHPSSCPPPWPSGC